jgi:hypothetical protein
MAVAGVVLYLLFSGHIKAVGEVLTGKVPAVAKPKAKAKSK